MKAQRKQELGTASTRELRQDLARLLLTNSMAIGSRCT